MLAIAFWRQPIYRLDAREVVGYEWLTRWSGDSTAESLWAWAAHHRQIPALEAWILDQLVQWRLQRRSPAGLWFVNLHPQGIVNTVQSHAERWQAWLHHLDPVVWELLEVGGWRSEVLDQLAHWQAACALDDWGDHSGAVTRLVEWPVQWIKMDGLLTQRLDHPGMRQWLSLIEQYAVRTQRQVILEGIETGQQLAWAQNLHIPFGQGFYLERPRLWKTVAWQPAASSTGAPSIVSRSGLRPELGTD